MNILFLLQTTNLNKTTKHILCKTYQIKTLYLNIDKTKITQYSYTLSNTYMRGFLFESNTSSLAWDKSPSTSSRHCLRMLLRDLA